MSTSKGLRMIEFFSGIGGMRYAAENALQESSEVTSLASCQAYDISINANRAYQHNFPNDESPVRTKLVEQLKPKDLDGKGDLWSMSPPCQPFTTTLGAKTLDSEDKRCNGLKGIIDLLTKIQEKPKHIFLENVKGFSSSQMIEEWYKCLKENGYTHKQYLVSPVNIGVPNHRQRYYILCERSDRWKDDETIIHEEIHIGEDEIQQHLVGDYIDQSLSRDYLDKLIVSDEILEKNWARQVGVVSKADTATHCFTAGYGRIFHRATGSLLLTRESEDSVEQSPIDRSDMMQYSGQLRRFAPKELLELFGFPASFTFPEEISLENRYKLIGNSINVRVVALLLKELLVGGKKARSLEKLQVGGAKGHIAEVISGNLLHLYNAYRWKMIPNCTGRHTCGDHAKVSTIPPMELLKEIGIEKKSIGESNDEDGDSELKEYQFQLPGRADKVHVIPLDTDNDTGIITFAKDDRGAYVHTLNTPSGFRRKLGCIGIKVNSSNVRLDENFPHAID